MATTYIVLAQEGGEPDPGPTKYVFLRQIEGAANAEKACRLVADEMDDASLEDGITLIAVPARNWTSGRNTFKAETRRRLLKS